MRICTLLSLALILAVGEAACAQGTELHLDASGQWVSRPGPEPGTDEAMLVEARRLLAEGEPSRAYRLVDPWIEEHRRSEHPLLAEAYLIRADALTADDDEYEALYDYELICKRFPGTEEFAKAVERELDIGVRYVNGLKYKRFGFRWMDGTREGVELLIRVQERMPGSRLAERAAIELADHYYRERELELASEMYDIFLKTYPRSEHRKKAMLRRVITNIARFNGARYDATGLVEARALIGEFRDTFPVDAQQAGLDDTLVARLDEALAAQMLDRAKVYERRRDPVSARFMLRKLLKRHPTTGAAERAAEMMDERGWTVSETPAEGGQ